MGSLTWLVLFLVGVLGGALNSVVGGGTFVVFPALLIAGIPAVSANATSTLVLWPGGISSALAYRKDIQLPRSLLLALCVASFAGGGIGGWLLIHTPGRAFVRLIPWLLLFATFLLTFGPQINAWLRPTSASEKSGGNRAIIAIASVQFLISIYGGYFGAGMGILMLAAFAISEIGNIHVMNGVRSILGILINGVALVLFIAAHAIEWRVAILMMIGATLAGYSGAAIARRVDPKIVKRVVLITAWSMTVYFFARTYHLV